MERLTKHSKQTSHENGICCTHFYGPECLEVGGNCAMNCKWEEKVWSRLAAYEDTELTPEEVLPKDKADEIALKLMRLADERGGGESTGGDEGWQLANQSAKQSTESMTVIVRTAGEKLPTRICR